MREFEAVEILSSTLGGTSHPPPGRSQLFRTEDGAVSINERISGIRQSEEPGRFARAGDSAQIGVREQGLIIREEEHPRVFTHRESRNELGECIQVKVRGQDAV